MIYHFQKFTADEFFDDVKFKLYMTYLKICWSKCIENVFLGVIDHLLFNGRIKNVFLFMNSKNVN